MHLPAMGSCELTPEFLANQDCLVIVTDHSPALTMRLIVKHRAARGRYTQCHSQCVSATVKKSSKPKTGNFAGTREPPT